MRLPARKIGRALLLATLVSTAVPAAAGVDRWTPYGPSGGAISDVVLHPRSPGTLWIASGPAYKSEDGGASFHLSASGLEGRSIQFLAIDPGQPDVLYAVPYSYNAGVYRSQDGGAHWTLIAGGDDFSFIWSLAVAPGPPGAAGTVFVGTTVRLYRSVDGGATFQPVISFGTAETFVAVAPDPRNPGTVYAATLSQRFKSTDFGATWTHLVEDRASPPWVHDLAVAPGDPQTLYETGDGADVGATWRSRDGGTTWQGPFPFRGDVLAVDPADANTVYGGSIRGLFVSHDGGETFTEVTEGVPPLGQGPSYGVTALAIDPAHPGIAIAGTGQGLFATVDRGATWTVEPQRGLIRNPVTNFRIDPFDPAHWILTSLGSYFESHDRGRTFAPFAVALERTEGIYDIEPDPFVRDRLWALTGRGLEVSRDGGATWLDRGPTPSASFALLPAAPGIFLVRAGDGIYRSTNSGHTWHRVKPVQLDDPLHRFQRLKQDPRSPRTIIGLGGRSDDSGRTWRPWHQADAIGFDPFRPRHVHLVEGDTLLITRDGGATLQTVGHLGLTDPKTRVLDLLFDRDRRDVLYAVTSAGGVLRSRDGGATWEPLDNGLPPSEPSRDNSLVQDPVDGRRFYATPGSGGLYRADFPGGR